ncbi:DUF1003 domain-containing protein [Roseomonas sp. CECT 9278]|uniref:DUF1003 domain-containing protein n=1 Tax=Roseomonas sp. CECT 9278 TaxID=2845823 RepID=UPI001E309A44|nr:DUF1003 domain-containing protein [Roseomonas sp. CECT 9278]CAH0210500.1 hypothetical protein ROS9278_02153 [Roseomonas sp. CECT 9278]
MTTSTTSHSHHRGGGVAGTHLRAALARSRRRRRAGKPPEPPTLGARLADGVAATVGSWRFIVVQSGLLGAWIIGNALVGSGAWDPYPFILLNLMLSFQAAYTAPIIMMSQNRSSDLDRDRATADYQVNIRAEAEIALLHEKVDLLRQRDLDELVGLLKAALARLDARDAPGVPA